MSDEEGLDEVDDDNEEEHGQTRRASRKGESCQEAC